MQMEPQEDPHDTRQRLIYNELMDHQRHVRHAEFHGETCRICANELELARQGRPGTVA